MPLPPAGYFQDLARDQGEMRTALEDQRQFVDDIPWLPPGGVSGDVLTKTTGADYAVAWAPPAPVAPTMDVLWEGPDPPTDPSIELWADTDEPMSTVGLVPTGGTVGQVLTKVSATDYATQWTTPVNVLPPGGVANAVLAKASPADDAGAWTTTPTLTGLAMNGDITLGNTRYVMGLTTGGGSTGLLLIGNDDNVYVAPGPGAGRTVQVGGAGATVKLGHPATAMGDLSVAGNLTVSGSATVTSSLNAGGNVVANNLLWVRGNWLSSTVGGIQAIAGGGGPDTTVYLGGNAPTYALGAFTANQNLTVNGNLYVNGTIVSKYAIRAAGFIDGTNGSLSAHFGCSGSYREGIGSYVIGTNVSGTIFATVTPHYSGLMGSVEVMNASQFRVRMWDRTGAIADCYFHFMVAII